MTSPTNIVERSRCPCSLDVFERVNKDVPLAGLNWFFDHAETISDRSISRPRAARAQASQAEAVADLADLT